MLVENQLVKIRWSGNNKKYYESKGYEYTKCGDFFLAKTEDLPKRCSAKVKVICDYCGKEYEKSWYHYQETVDSKDCCKNCKTLKKNETTLLARQESLYSKVLDCCNKKGYKLVTQKEEIKNNKTYIKYICPKHGIHSMRIANLESGKGCPECIHEKHREVYKTSCNEVVKRIEDCGGILLNKEDYINQSTKNLKVICPNCGNTFITSLRNFTQHGGQACDKCCDNESIGEKKIKNYLENNGIYFKQEYWFQDCRDVKPLPFDFYLPNQNIIIEFDGRQHFEETKHFRHSLETVKKHDEIKNKYCHDNGICLIRIPYTKMNKIEEILENELFLHEDIV